MKTKILCCLLTTSFLLLCCNCVSCKKCCKSLPSSQIEKSLVFQVDDSVKHLLGDTLAQVIFDADSIKLYSLSVKNPDDSLKKDSTKLDSVGHPNFHGSYITHDFGILSKNEASPLLFILSDRDNYLSDEARLKSPFTPNVALSFKKGDVLVDVIFSFTGGQMCIFVADEEKLYYKYTYERLIMRFFQCFLQDERISAYLNL